ncbi:MAG: methyltransferase regulatory domain-containing protein [Betaproteobacteria bacterium]|nr:methyltransferase regulatory domain-containing protein [Betaproteobacteria bacterium]
MAQEQTPYDAIPYSSHPFAQSHPDRLASIAKLFGLDAPAVDNCRVLELGCSMGGNLIAMAQKHLGADFIGIDASSRQIAEGWKVVDALHLKNVALKHLDILDVSDSLGKFDYIVSHGVYSWVPPAVQNKMLDLCKRHLAANGVAYISYNTYPGWHVRGIVRDMMLYRSMQFSDPATRLAQAKLLVEFVAKSSPGADDPYRKLLQGELDVLIRSDDYYLHHDHLEENNHPVYFHEFARRLGVNGLQYLGEADFSTMVSTNFAPDIAKTLHDLGAHDILQMEQYMDFVRCRYFRQTLICHSAVRLNRQLTPALVKNLLLASQAAPDTHAASAEASDLQTFRTPGGRGITCRSPVTKNALRTLQQQWPASVPFQELLSLCKSTGATDDEFLANEMLACMAAGVVEWRLSPDPFTTKVTRKPATTPSARLQASQGNRVTNLRDITVTLDDIHRSVLRHLEGKQNRKQLADTLIKFLAEGGHELRRESDNTPVTDPAEMRNLLDTALDKVLQNLAAKALLLRDQ